MAKEIKMLSLDELEQMNEKELKAEVARLKARLRSRRASLKKSGLDEYVDTVTPKINKSEFSAEKQRLLAEIKQLQEKLSNPLTTVKGARKHLRESAKGVKESNATSGGAGHERYTAIMDLVPESERDSLRESFASDEVFEIGDIIAEGKSYKEAIKEYDEKVSSELEDLLGKL